MLAVDTRKRSKKGGYRIGGIRLFVLLSLLSAPLLADELEAVRALAAAGAPQLAIYQLDAAQPAVNDDLRGWLRWERARIELLSEQKHWQELVSRLALLPEQVPHGFARWARTRRAEALLAIADAAGARRELQGLIWSGEGDAQQLAQWRRLVMRSYLAEGRRDDAYTALLRYRQDYGNDNRDDARLSARVLLSQRRLEEAAVQLDRLDPTPEVEALKLLLRLRRGERQLYKTAQKLAEQHGETDDDQLYALLWATAAEAAGDEPAYRITALEGLFSRRNGLTGQRDLFTYTPDDLWRAYIAYAEKVGNHRHLLLGDDRSWFELAAVKPRHYPIRSRSLLALLAHQGSSETSRSRAHGLLADKLLAIPRGFELLRHLYLDDEPFGPPETLPVALRQRLVDRVIAEADLKLAARLLTGMDEAPDSVDGFVWQLRRAKVFALAGDHTQAEAVINTLIGSARLKEAEALDRLIQLIFDLQTVGEHERAYHLLRRLYVRIADIRQRRELLYWMADSKLAQKEPFAAARLYLESATLIGVTAMDPWAQTARYQAAKALAEAELVDDARTLYRQLLAATDDPQRRAVLQREMEQLNLLREPTG